MVQYKTFCLKHYIVFFKKTPATGQITFSSFGRFRPIGGHWEKMDQLIKRMIWGFLSIDLALLSIRHLPDTHQTPSRHLSDTFQTPSRHLTDTSQTPENGGFWAIAGHWQKRNQLTLLLLQVKFYVYLVQACSLHKPQSRKSNSQTEISWTTFQEHLGNLGGTY